MKQHLIFDITVSPIEPYREILTAELFDIGFEGCVETVDGVKGYVNEADFNRVDFQKVLDSDFFKDIRIVVISETVEKERNWNQEWEDRFEPVLIDGRLLVRAPFNIVQGDFDAELIISPKMSFGTGHHATTSLMLELLLTEPMPKSVLDMGSGTGVLAIFCKKQGAEKVVAIDIDDWAFENTRENMLLNKVKEIDIRHGDASKIGEDMFDLIIANINRNVLLADMHVYAKHLLAGAPLLLSGFYTEDLELIKAEAAKQGMALDKHLDKDNWVAARFSKN